MRTVGEQIAARRRMLGLTQQEVADHIRVDHSFVSLLENDKRDPSLGTLRDIAATLGARLEVRLIPRRS